VVFGEKIFQCKHSNLYSWWSVTEKGLAGRLPANLKVKEHSALQMGSRRNEHIHYVWCPAILPNNRHFYSCSPKQ